MDTLSTLDAEFLHLEDGVVHMHIAGACVFDGDPPAFEDLAALVAGKLHQIPRYRQRVRSVPLGLGRPVWADDPHFRLEHHLRHTALPAPGDDAAFCTLMGRLMSSELDRERPLWETWLVEGLEGGRWALIFKVHHCLVDGVAGAELLEVLLDLEPTADVLTPQPWSPSPEPPGAAKVLAAWSGLAGDLLEAAGGVPHALGDPVGTARSVVPTVEGLVRWIGGLGVTSPESLAGPIGPHRVWAHADVDLVEVKAIGKALGGTVNDVVLAAVTGGYRDLLLERGDDVAHAVVRSLVPVSTRRADAHGVLDNRVSALLCELPVGVADPVERLSLVREQMQALKGSHMAEAGSVLTEVGDLAPPAAVAIVSRLAARTMRRLPQRSINTVTTNVPGPQLPLYCLGREMVEYRPFVPIFHGVPVGTAILSYNGRVFFGVTGDDVSAPEVGVVAQGTVRAVDELAAAAPDTTASADERQA